LPDNLFDTLTRHQIYLQRFGSHEANEFEPYLKRADKIIREVLSRYPEDIPTKAALNEINRELRQRVSPVYSEYTDLLMVDLESLSESEASFTTKALDKAIEPDIVAPISSSVWAATLARPVTTESTARFMAAMLDEFSATEVDRVNQVVVSGFYEGKTSTQIARSIRGTRKNRFTDGILNTTNRNAGVIARTAVNHTATQAKMATYKKNKRYIKKWEFSATLDGRTSSTCRGLNGTEWPIGEGPEPPRHFSCRSSALPIVDKRLSLFGDAKESQVSVGASGAQVVTKPDNYYDWLKTQPESFQEDVLGKSRAQLFRDGGLSTEKFRKLTITNYGDPLTLSEMQAKDAQAFERAGLT
jgi:SPP1 gp7 family putative phage head morphogenesis protein